MPCCGRASIESGAALIDRDYYVVLNPASNRGRAAKLAPVVESALRRLGARVEVALTTERGHGEALAYAAAREGRGAVVAVGGDGIVHEVANGLLRAAGEAATIPMGVVGAGSGNDFAKMIGMPTKTERAIERIVGASPRTVDAGRVTRWTVESGRTAPWYFTNGVGLGFDAQVAVRASRIRRLRGMAIYLTAVIRVLSDLRSPRMRVTIDGVEVADRRLILTTVANGACHGGSFWLCPDARVDDGMLDVLVGDARSVPEVMALIPRVMRGKHLGARGVAIHRGRRVVISSDEPLPIHADGEIVGEGVREIEMELLPGRLTVLA